MTVYRIRSTYLRTRGEKFETINRRSAEAKLADVKKRDPNARLIQVGTR